MLILDTDVLEQLIATPIPVRRVVSAQRSSTIEVAHIITGLGTGGAETMLLKLLSHSDRARFSSRVYSLSAASSAIADRIRALGVPVTSFSMTREAPDPWAIVRLSRALRASRADIVQTWMYHADLVGSIATKLAVIGAPIVWNIRQGNLDRELNRPRTLALIRLCAKLSSRVPDAIICCSSDARRVHSSIGYCDEKIRVIGNGFDTEVFRPDAAARAAVRAELGIADDMVVIGLVARFDPQKDHRTFISAAARLVERRPGVRFLLCGSGITTNNAALMEWIDAAGLRGACHLLGERTDVPRRVAAMDLASLSSRGEGFPNVLGEAMSCGVPCVATNVGDSAVIIGDTGLVVPPRDPAALAEAWEELLVHGRSSLEDLGTRARRRVAEKFSIDVVVRSYEQAYEEIVASRRRGAHTTGRML